MAQKEGFKPYHQGQTMLLPLSVEEFVPADHKARIISAVVDKMDRIIAVSCGQVKLQLILSQVYHRHDILHVLMPTRILIKTPCSQCAYAW